MVFCCSSSKGLRQGTCNLIKEMQSVLLLKERPENHRVVHIIRYHVGSIYLEDAYSNHSPLTSTGTRAESGYFICPKSHKK